MRVYHTKLRAGLAKQLPSRAHIVEENFCHGVSEYLLHSKLEGAKDSTQAKQFLLLTLCYPPGAGMVTTAAASSGKKCSFHCRVGTTQSCKTDLVLGRAEVESRRPPSWTERLPRSSTSSAY